MSTLTFHKATRPIGVLSEVPDYNNNLYRHGSIKGFPGVRFQIIKIEADSMGFEWYTIQLAHENNTATYLIAPRDLHNVY